MIQSVPDRVEASQDRIASGDEDGGAQVLLRQKEAADDISGAAFLLGDDADANPLTVRLGGQDSGRNRIDNVVGLNERRGLIVSLRGNLVKHDRALPPATLCPILGTTSSWRAASAARQVTLSGCPQSYSPQIAENEGGTRALDWPIRILAAPPEDAQTPRTAMVLA